MPTYAPPPPPEKTSSRPPRTRARGIVVAETDVLLGELVRASFGGGAFEVVQAASVEALVREVQATVTVLAVVDDDLPLVRGVDVLGRLRRERPDLEAVLITRDAALSAFAERLHVERLTCLPKPLHLEDLRAAVTHSLARLGRGAAPFSTPPRASEAPPGVRDGESGEGLRVLVVDDDPLVRRSMARTFRRHRVTTAENGRAAAAAIERSKPDVIISDLKMPEMDGFELAEQIKERWPDLANRIVFVSGKSAQIERARTEAPAQPIVMKPVNSQELEARMAEVLEAATRRR